MVAPPFFFPWLAFCVFGDGPLPPLLGETPPPPPPPPPSPKEPEGVSGLLSK